MDGQAGLHTCKWVLPGAGHPSWMTSHHPYLLTSQTTVSRKTWIASTSCCFQSEGVVVQLLSWVQLLEPHRQLPARLLCLWDFPGNNTGLGCHFLLQGIFPTQEWNLCLLHQQVDSLLLNHLGSPRYSVAAQELLLPLFLSWEPILHCVSRDSLEISKLYTYISSFGIAFPS